MENRSFRFGRRPKPRFGGPVFSFSGDHEKILREQQRRQQLHNEQDKEGFGGTVQVSLSQDRDFDSTVVYTPAELESIRQRYLGLVQDLEDALVQSWERSRRLMGRQGTSSDNNNNGENLDPAAFWTSSSPRRPHDITVIRTRLADIHSRFGLKLFETKRGENGGTMLTNPDLHRCVWSLMLSHLTGLTLPTLLELVEVFIFYRVEEGRIMELLVPETNDAEKKSILKEDGSGIFQLVHFLQDTSTVSRLGESDTTERVERPLKRRRTLTGDVPSYTKTETLPASSPAPLPLSLVMLFVHLADRELVRSASQFVVSKEDLEKRLFDIRSQGRSLFGYEDAARLYFLERILLNQEQSSLSLEEVQDIVLSHHMSAFDALTKASGLSFLVVNTRIVEMIFLRNEIEGAQAVACRLLTRANSLYYKAKDLKDPQPDVFNRKRASFGSAPSHRVFISETLQELLDPAYPLCIWTEVMLSFPHELEGCLLMAMGIEQNRNFNEDQRIKIYSKIFDSFLCNNQLYDLDFTFMESNPLYIFVSVSSFYAVQLFCRMYLDLWSKLDDLKDTMSKEEYMYMCSATEETVCYFLHSKFPYPESLLRYEKLQQKGKDSFLRFCENLKKTANSPGPSARRPDHWFPLIQHPREDRMLVDFRLLFRKVGILPEDKDPLPCPTPKNLFSVPFDFAQAAGDNARSKIDEKEDARQKDTEDECLAGPVNEGDEEQENEDVLRADVEQGEEESEGEIIEIEEDEEEYHGPPAGGEGAFLGDDTEEIEEDNREDYDGVSIDKEADSRDDSDGEQYDRDDEAVAQVASDDESDGGYFQETTKDESSAQGKGDQQSNQFTEEYPSSSRDLEMGTEVESPDNRWLADDAEGDETDFASPQPEANQTPGEQSPVAQEAVADTDYEMEQTPPPGKNTQGALLAKALASHKGEATSTEADQDNVESVTKSGNGGDVGTSDNEPGVSALSQPSPDTVQMEVPKRDVPKASCDTRTSVAGEKTINSGAKQTATLLGRPKETNMPAGESNEPWKPKAEGGDMVDVDAGYEAAEEDHYDISRGLSGEMPAYDSASQEDASSLAASQSAENAYLIGMARENLDRLREVNLATARTAHVQEGEDQGYDATAEDSQGHTEEEEDRPTDNLGTVDIDTERSSVLEELHGQNDPAEDLVDGYDATAEESQGHNSDEEEERPNQSAEHTGVEMMKSSAIDDEVGDKSSADVVLVLSAQNDLLDTVADGYEATAEESQGHTEEEEERPNEPSRHILSGAERSGGAEDKPPSVRDGYDAAAEDESQEHTEEEEDQLATSTTKINSAETLQLCCEPEPREKVQRHVAFENVDEGYMPDDAHTEDERPVKRKRGDGYQGGDSSICPTEDEGAPTDNEEEEANRQPLSIQKGPTIQQAGVPHDAQSLSGMSAADDRTAGKQEDDESSELEDVDGDCQEPIPPLAGGSSLQDFAAAAQHAVRPRKQQNYVTSAKPFALFSESKAKKPSLDTRSPKSTQTTNPVIEQSGGDIEEEFEEIKATDNISNKEVAASNLIEGNEVVVGIEPIDKSSSQSLDPGSTTDQFRHVDAVGVDMLSSSSPKNVPIADTKMEIEETGSGSTNPGTQALGPVGETMDIENVLMAAEDGTSEGGNAADGKMDVEDGELETGETMELENDPEQAGKQACGSGLAGDTRMEIEESGARALSPGPAGETMDVENGLDDTDGTGLVLAKKSAEINDVVMSIDAVESNPECLETFGDANTPSKKVSVDRSPDAGDILMSGEAAEASGLSLEPDRGHEKTQVEETASESGKKGAEAHEIVTSNEVAEANVEPGMGAEDNQGEEIASVLASKTAEADRPVTSVEVTEPNVQSLEPDMGAEKSHRIETVSVTKSAGTDVIVMSVKTAEPNVQSLEQNREVEKNKEEETTSGSTAKNAEAHGIVTSGEATQPSVLSLEPEGEIEKSQGEETTTVGIAEDPESEHLITSGKAVEPSVQSQEAGGEIDKTQGKETSSVSVAENLEAEDIMMSGEAAEPSVQSLESVGEGNEAGKTKGKAVSVSLAKSVDTDEMVTPDEARGVETPLSGRASQSATPGSAGSAYAGWSIEEHEMFMKLHDEFGNKWTHISRIMSQLGIKKTAHQLGFYFRKLEKLRATELKVNSDLKVNEGDDANIPLPAIPEDGALNEYMVKTPARSTRERRKKGGSEKDEDSAVSSLESHDDMESQSHRKPVQHKGTQSVDGSDALSDTDVQVSLASGGRRKTRKINSNDSSGEEIAVASASGKKSGRKGSKVKSRDESDGDSVSTAEKERITKLGRKGIKVKSRDESDGGSVSTAEKKRITRSRRSSAEEVSVASSKETKPTRRSTRKSRNS